MIKKTDIFHVHTYRCGHAENVSDEAYIKKAIELGAKGIWFTDHTPFPGDPFFCRMKYEELNGYIEELKRLKDLYAEKITVHIGLETEFFSSFDRLGYYKELKANPDIELLLLGQHMAALPEGGYSYDLAGDILDEKEYLLLGEALIEGIESGYFDIAAHPDRIFRRRNEWDDNMAEMAEMIIRAARNAGMTLEKNISSMNYKNYFRKEFWDLTENRIETVYGLDAHAVKDLIIVP